MATNDNSLFPNLVWNRFNSDFRLPESDDAARIAAEVKISVDTWIQTSLAQLESNMNARAQVAVAQINSQIVQSKTALTTMTAEFNRIAGAAAALSPTDPALAEKLNTLQAATAAARNAVALAAANWEKYGADAVATVKSIVSTMATLAV